MEFVCLAQNLKKKCIGTQNHQNEIFTQEKNPKYRIVTGTIVIICDSVL
jgi:hypothetical protein